jgi:signal transduction histidine kinase
MSRQLNEEENIRNEFIATLSHEIRTPLSSIRESVNMIIEEVFGPINEKQRKFLTIASVEIQRINKLLNYLLNVSVLESDVRKKKSARLDTKQLMLSSAEIFASFAEKKKVTLTVSDISQCPDLYGVREELQQVFVNIIGNAIKYSPEKGSVMVSWTKDKTKKFLLFQVSDTGPGIADDELSLVFTKYYRTKTVRGHLDGVGLGLAISRKIVSSYGGKIHVTNNKGGGCTFSFTLPTRP